ncbi:M48 family metalloprotease [Candidatus Reidiella endopervernicosa]|nr:M48 family metalloprotease [Candidatus Reidiella endopervernicosa]
MIKPWFSILGVVAGVVLLTIPAQAGFSIGGFSIGGSGGDVEGIDIGRIVSSGSKVFKGVSDEDELEIGHEAAAVLLGVAPLVKDRRIQKYVNRVGHWVALQTERPDIAWRFGVLDTDAANAFAAPGGYVFITRGLLMRMQSEAELAGVLAHECAHVLVKHHLKAVETNAQLDLAGALAGAAVDREDRFLLNRLSSGFQEIYARGLDKDDEYQADRMGVVIAARAGYDPYGLHAMLQTLAATDPDDSALAFMFKTHPHPGDRLEELEGGYDHLDPHADQPSVERRFQQQVVTLH